MAVEDELQQKFNSIIAELKSDRDSVSHNAFRELVEIGNNQAMNILLSAFSFGDEDNNIGQTAALWIKKLHDKESIDYLINLFLSDADVRIRDNAAFALSQLRESKLRNGRITPLSSNGTEIYVLNICSKTPSNLVLFRIFHLSKQFVKHP